MKDVQHTCKNEEEMNAIYQEVQGLNIHDSSYWTMGNPIIHFSDNMMKAVCDLKPQKKEVSTKEFIGIIRNCKNR